MDNFEQLIVAELMLFLNKGMFMPSGKSPFYLSIFFMLIVFFSCFFRKSIPDNVKRSLQIASENAPELRKVIAYYSNNEEDSLKLQSAYFLIANMPGKGFEEYELQDSSGRRIDIDLFAFRNPDSLQHFKKEYEIKNKTILKFVKLGFKEDIKTITADLLIENIDYAFEAWQLPWARYLTFQQFCELVLPYRLGNEPLQEWRKLFFENNIWIKDSIRDEKDIIRACGMINDRLKRKYEYRHGELDFYPGMLDVEKVEKFGGGRCEDLNMYAGYSMRAVGIPIALEFTPFWANSNYGGHSWLGVLNYDERFVPFNAVYDNPVLDSLPFAGAKLAKAYRVSFSELSPLISTNDSAAIPLFFKNKNYYDITREYLPIKAIKLGLKKMPYRPKFAFLGVLNGYGWKPIGFGEIQGDSALFSNVALDVIYAPLYYFKDGYYAADEFLLAGDAFFLSASGKTQILHPDKLNTTDIAFNLQRLPWLIPGRKYNAIHWSGIDWVADSVQCILNKNPRKPGSEKEVVVVKNLPSGTMYRLINDSLKKEADLGRPFIFNNDKKVYKDY